MLLCGALLVCAVAVTVFAVRRHNAISVERSDTLFWDLFMGSAVAVPALLIPTVASPWAGVPLCILGVAAGIGAYRYSPRAMEWEAHRRQRRQEYPMRLEAEARHEALLARWRRYELDPACSIDYPAMTDVRLPETSALIKAIREAEHLRSVPHEGYAPAVARLEVSLAAAEKAAGIPANGG
jgi:hypothetical protein